MHKTITDITITINILLFQDIIKIPRQISQYFTHVYPFYVPLPDIYSTTSVETYKLLNPNLLNFSEATSNGYQNITQFHFHKITLSA